MHNAQKKFQCDGMFGEIENSNEFNLKTWKRYGFKHIPVKYKQLSLGDGRRPLDNLLLCVLPFNGQKNIPAKIVKQLVYNYYRWS